MQIDQRIAAISLAATILGAVGGWLLSDARSRGAENERMTQLEKQLARLPEIEDQRQRERDRADRLDLEVISLRQRIDDITAASSLELTQLREKLQSTQKELSHASQKASAQQKCAYLDELTRESKNKLDNFAIVTVVGGDGFASQENERRNRLLGEFEDNRSALLECLKG